MAPTHPPINRIAFINLEKPVSTGLPIDGSPVHLVAEGATGFWSWQ